MSRHTTVMALPETSRVLQIPLFAGAIGILVLLWTVAARAADQAIPWECSGYTGEAQTRCLNTFIELQREEIGKLKGQLQAQEGTVEHLKQQATAADQNRQPAAPPAIIPPTPYIYSYVYPPAVGLGLYLGRPWIYGSPYYYRPYWGPRFYGH